MARVIWRNVRSYGEMSGITMAECQALFWRNVRSYGEMPGAMQECHELWWNVKSYYDRGMSVAIMAECQELLRWNIRS